jgi:hypothetical protein
VDDTRTTNIDTELDMRRPVGEKDKWEMTLCLKHVILEKLEFHQTESDRRLERPRSPLFDEAPLNQLRNVINAEWIDRPHCSSLVQEMSRNVSNHEHSVVFFFLKNNNVADLMRLENAAKAMDWIICLNAIRLPIEDIGHAWADVSNIHRCLDAKAIELILRDIVHMTTDWNITPRWIKFVLKARVTQR